MYEVLGTSVDEFTGTINDEGNNYVLFVYDLLGVCKIK
jgi:hypothetical protein